MRIEWLITWIFLLGILVNTEDIAWLRGLYFVCQGIMVLGLIYVMLFEGRIRRDKN